MYKCTIERHLSCCQFGATMNKFAVNTVYRIVCKHILLHFIGLLRNVIVGMYAIACFFKTLPNYFLERLYHFTFPPAIYE